jgi:L-lactate dehydrogenase complex protein LldG
MSLSFLPRGFAIGGVRIVDSREAILKDVRKVTRREDPPVIHEFRSEVTDPLERLEACWKMAGGKFFAAANMEQLKETLLGILGEKNAKTVAVRDTTLARDLDLEAKGFTIIQPHTPQIIKSADAGITAPDYAIADTGTLVEITGRNLDRTVSLVPPWHVAIVKEEKVLRSLHDLWPKVVSAKESHTITFITGPSRTADIEQILTIGVHGPKEANLILLRTPGN